MIASLLFAGGCVLALGALSLVPRWVQRLALGGLGLMGGALLAHGVIYLEGGAALAGLLALALAWGLDAILLDIRRAHAAMPPSREAPGAPHGAGEAGERDGERDAPILPGVGSTAGCAGRPRSFSGVSS